MINNSIVLIEKDETKCTELKWLSPFYFTIEIDVQGDQSIESFSFCHEKVSKQ